jgi:hypothetical protein
MAIQFQKLFEQSNENVWACTLVCLVHQSIDIHITYLCCEYQFIWSFDKWFIDISILANQSKEHVHAHWDWDINELQCIDAYL